MFTKKLHWLLLEIWWYLNSKYPVLLFLNNLYIQFLNVVCYEYKFIKWV